MPLLNELERTFILFCAASLYDTSPLPLLEHSIGNIGGNILRHTTSIELLLIGIVAQNVAGTAKGHFKNEVWMFGVCECVSTP
jgi:hypothetical protein